MPLDRQSIMAMACRDEPEGAADSILRLGTEVERLRGLLADTYTAWSRRKGLPVERLLEVERACSDALNVERCEGCGRKMIGPHGGDKWCEAECGK